MNYLFRLAEAMPWWVVVLIFAGIAWFAIPAMWRCAKCGRRNRKEGESAAFCSNCGAPRPRGKTAVPVPIPVKSSDKINGTIRQLVSEILQTERVAEALPAGTIATATVRAKIEAGTTVGSAHPTWLPEAVHRMHTLPPFPKQGALETVPADVVLVEIEAAEFQTGGRGSFFDYVGLFASLLISLPERRVWDARADDAR